MHEDPECAVKQHRTTANLFCGVSAVTPTTACTIRPRNACKNTTGPWPFCFGAGVGPFRSQMHHLGIQLDPFRALKVHVDSVFQGLYLPLRMWGEHMCIFNAKTAQDAGHFFRGGFGPFRFQMHLLGIKLDPFTTIEVHFECVVQCLYLTHPAFSCILLPCILASLHFPASPTHQW